MQARDGMFYGITNGGGTSFGGSVYRMTSTGTVTILHSFGGRGNGSAEGFGPDGQLIQTRDGNFLGTTLGGGTSGKGTIFMMTAAGMVTTKHSFTGEDGASPFGALVQETDGTVYGATRQGPAGSSTVFKMTSGGEVKTLHVFKGGPDGRPAGLVLARDGNLYATTLEGGLAGGGTIVRITRDGVATVVHEFKGLDDGAHPEAAMIQATDGNLYGTAGGGPTMTQFFGSRVSVFRLTANGLLETLCRFAYSGDNISELSQAPDGSFFGTTSAGGTTNEGTVFRVGVDGVLTTLHSFAGQPDEARPYKGVVRGRDGKLYGVTSGMSGGGTIFRVTP